MHDVTTESASTRGGAVAAGLTTIADDGTVLDTWFPAPRLTTGPGPAGTVRLSAEEAVAELGEGAAQAQRKDPRRGVEVVAVRTTISSLDDKPLDTHDVYLRLHLLSHRLVPPHGQNLDGIFGLLPNVAWTSIGAVQVERVEQARLAVRAEGGQLAVYGIDKFPRMTDFVSPSGVRIAHADRVRLGAHLAPGTTVMHEGFVNFNAGTLGTSMVEGRISAGVVVGDHSDVGGGASIMGTLSAAASRPSRWASAAGSAPTPACGISLGDDLRGGGGRTSPPAPGSPCRDGKVAKAVELSGQSDLLFRRNSQTGAVEVIARSGSWGGLNAELHVHNEAAGSGPRAARGREPGAAPVRSAQLRLDLGGDQLQVVEVVEVEDLEVDPREPAVRVAADLVDHLVGRAGQSVRLEFVHLPSDGGRPAGHLGVVLADADDQRVGVHQVVRRSRRRLRGGRAPGRTAARCPRSRRTAC